MRSKCTLFGGFPLHGHTLALFTGYTVLPNLLQIKFKKFALRKIKRIVFWPWPTNQSELIHFKIYPKKPVINIR